MVLPTTMAIEKVANHLFGLNNHRHINNIKKASKCLHSEAFFDVYLSIQIEMADAA